MKMQGYNGSQCWDTSFAVQAVHAAGLCSEFPVMIARAHAFLERTQILSSDTARATAADSFEAPAMRRRYFRHTSRGGWPFSTSAHGWPISDCTAEGECNWPNLSTVVVRMVARGGGCRDIRMRVEILGLQKRRIVEKSQSVVIMINPIIFTRTHMYMYCQHGFILLCGGAVPCPGLKAMLLLSDEEGLAPLADVRLFDAVHVLLTLQNADGGWATYENTRGWRWFERLNPSEVFGDIMIE
jgi:squalene cyclase